MNRPFPGLLAHCIIRSRWGLAALAAALSLGAPGAGRTGTLAHPSPDWRDQVIYFVMTDRFDDGNPRNDDQHAGEFDPANGAKYSGGDLAGVQRRLSYIQGLGATAVWITPPVANQWWSTTSNYGGYHGYWASDFSRVDAHLGTLRDYQALSRDLHGRGMLLVQDIVVNHVGNWFHYADAPPASDPAHGYRRFADGQQRLAPTQWPFSQNDPSNPAQRRLAVYHWTPDIRDMHDARQVLDWQLAGLDDLNTENPLVRRALRKAYGNWIREAGVDAFRVDTTFYVPPGFLEDFMHSAEPAAQGIARVAAATGRRDFLAFGEGFAIDKPYDDAGARSIEAYVRDGARRRGLPSMLNFPLYGTLGDVFARGHAPMELAWRITDMMRVHADPWRMPTFIDNHDVDRFLAGGNAAGMKQALLAIFTLPGIPAIYYGTEQGFREQRGAMFAGGYGSGGMDHFDTGAPMYRWLQTAIALRRGHRVFSRGTPQMLAAEGFERGAVAWRTTWHRTTALTAMNTASAPATLDIADTGLPAGTRLRPLFAIDGNAPVVTIGRNGGLHTVLPARAGWVWTVDGPVARRLAPRPWRPAADTRAWVSMGALEDAANDDTGPSGRYTYPDDAVWRGRHPADLRGLRAATANGALKLEITLPAVITTWSPPNGFDHVAFTVFIDFPGRDGRTSVMPLQNASLPDGLHWTLRIRAHGWSNALFSAAGADATHEGTLLDDSARIATDPVKGTVTFTLPATAIGAGQSLEGARVVVATWDYDGGFRGLAPTADGGRFGGGDGARDPLWMDVAGPLVLHAATH